MNDGSSCAVHRLLHEDRWALFVQGRSHDFRALAHFQLRPERADGADARPLLPGVEEGLLASLGDASSSASCFCRIVSMRIGVNFGSRGERMRPLVLLSCISLRTDCAMHGPWPQQVWSMWCASRSLRRWRTVSPRCVALTAETHSVLHALPSAGVTLSKEMVIVLVGLPGQGWG